jgi:hypothetical protein
MFKNALAALGLLALVVLASSAMFRQFQVPVASVETYSVHPEQLVSFHEDFAPSTAPATRVLVPQVGGNGIVVTSVTVSPTNASGASWSVDVLENGTVKAGVAGTPVATAPRPESVIYPGIKIARGSGLSLRARTDTSVGVRVTVTGYVW